MKTFYAVLLLTFCIEVAGAQTSVPRTPLYEVFSSSTCGPCKPANDHLVPIFEEKEESIAVIKYQMSWPGNGDPYYTSEGNSRRSTYGVNAIPAFYRNGLEQDYSLFGESSVEDDLQEEAGMKMYLRYMIDPDAQSVAIKANIEPLMEYTAGAHKLFIAIVERINYNNVKSNGETEFHNVFKKMLPESNGQIIIGAIEAAEVIEYETTYVFQGDYRLPADSDDEIDNATEHSVEDFDNLHVVMFMQSLATDKAIYQAVRGERVTNEEDLQRPWGAPVLTIEEFNAGKHMAVYPNPAGDVLNVEFVAPTENTTISLIDMCGHLVAQQAGATVSNRMSISVSGLKEGMYVLQVWDGQRKAVQKISVMH